MIRSRDARGKGGGQATVNPKPPQSELSRRWARECHGGGRSRKLEAIFRIQKEASEGKDVLESCGDIARLFKDEDGEVTASAIWAARVCVENGVDQTLFLPGLVGALHSTDDVVVETAIDAIGECARSSGRLGWHMILNHLGRITKNGASPRLKADAGFAIAQAVCDNGSIMADKELAMKATGAFVSLLKKGEFECRMAGATGIACAAVAIAGREELRGSARMRQHLNYLVPTLLNGGEQGRIAMDGVTISGRRGADLSNVIEMVLVSIIATRRGDEDMMERAAEAVRIALSDPRTSEGTMQLVMAFTAGAVNTMKNKSPEASEAFTEEMMALAKRKIAILQRLFAFGAEMKIEGTTLRNTLF